MSNSVIPALGLRQRKRAQTADAIHIAAAELALERGLESATIEAITERADVSTRTFFNYFPTKEDAILGLDEVAVTAELERVAAIRPDGDPLRQVFDLIYGVFDARGGAKAHTELTRQVMQRYPQLVSRQMVRIAELEDIMSSIIAGWLTAHEGFQNDTDAERLEEARVILGLCLSTVRVSMKNWASSTASAADAGDPRKPYERAIAMLRAVLDKI
jgi:AcrR family transcriptional regulator